MYFAVQQKRAIHITMMMMLKHTSCYSKTRARKHTQSNKCCCVNFQRSVHKKWNTFLSRIVFGSVRACNYRGVTREANRIKADNVHEKKWMKRIAKIGLSTTILGRLLLAENRGNNNQKESFYVPSNDIVKNGTSKHRLHDC